jgi:hypothetical protein
MAYMEIFGNASHYQQQQQQNAMVRHSVHSFAHTTKSISQSASTDFSPKKPALPPKENKKISSLMFTSNNNTPPSSPKINNDHHSMIESIIAEDQEDCPTPTIKEFPEFPTDDLDSVVVLRNKGKSIDDVRIL